MNVDICINEPVINAPRLSSPVDVALVFKWRYQCRNGTRHQVITLPIVEGAFEKV